MIARYKLEEDGDSQAVLMAIESLRGAIVRGIRTEENPHVGSNRFIAGLRSGRAHSRTFVDRRTPRIASGRPDQGYGPKSVRVAAVVLRLDRARAAAATCRSRHCAAVLGIRGDVLRPGRRFRGVDR